MAETCWALESAWNGLSHSGAGGLAVRKSYLDTCTPMFIAALFIIPNTWKQHKCPSTDEWIKMMWYMYVCVCAHTHVLSRFSHIQLFATLWTVACQSPLSMGFSRQEYWSGLPCPPPGESSQPRDWTCVSYHPLHWQVGSLLLVPSGKPLFFSSVNIFYIPHISDNIKYLSFSDLFH